MLNCSMPLELLEEGGYEKMQIKASIAKRCSQTRIIIPIKIIANNRKNVPAV